MDVLPCEESAASTNQVIERLLTGSLRMYTLAEFRDRCDLGISSVAELNFWRMIESGHLIEIDDTILMRCGYSGSTLSDMKTHFKKILTNGKIAFHETPVGKQKTIISVDPPAFIQAVMKMRYRPDNDLHKWVRKYNHIFGMYTTYAHEFEKKRLADSNDMMSRKLDLHMKVSEERERLAAEERARAQVERDQAQVERDQAQVERDQAQVEREQAQLERVRAEEREKEAVKARNLAEEERAEAVAARKLAEKQAEILLAYSEKCAQDLKNIVSVLEYYVRNATIQPSDPSLNTFYVMYLIEQTSVNGMTVNSIYTARRQSRTMSRVLLTIANDYPNARISELMSFEPDANAIHLYIDVKKYIRENKIMIHIDGNLIHLGTSFTPDAFVSLVCRVRDQRGRMAAAAKAMLEYHRNDHVTD